MKVVRLEKDWPLALTLVKIRSMLFKQTQTVQEADKLDRLEASLEKKCKLRQQQPS